jgi:hypothetical protein
MWETTASTALNTLRRPPADATTAEPYSYFQSTAVEGSVSISLPMDLEQASRLAATSILLGLTPPAAVQRAIATQWFLDKNLSTGLELVFHGDNRFRRRVTFPVTPTIGTNR